ncbi:MAG: transposase family protein [Chloroflexi bacterium]|nr:transposase family protein [Chloroflexota bacterium]
MAGKKATTLEAYSADLPDPRVERSKRHLLIDVIVIAVCAVLCGAENRPDVAAFGRTKEAWLKQSLALEQGIPSHNAFWRVFRRLDSAGFERRFLAWVRAAVTLGEGELWPLTARPCGALMTGVQERSPSTW